MPTIEDLCCSMWPRFRGSRREGALNLSRNFQGALDATLLTFSIKFQHALDATLLDFSRNFGFTLAGNIIVQFWSLERLGRRAQLKSLYVKPPDEDKSDHVREASSKLLARLQEAASGSPIACMWRQTANCNATHGEREPDRDKLCSENVPLGNSGFCDCNGDNQKNGDELGYDCQSTPGSCETVRPQALQDRRMRMPHVDRKDLKWLLWQLHRSLGGAIHPKDEKSWQLAASAFEEDASTVVKYQSYGPKHAMFFKTNGVELEKAIDPRMWTLISESFRRGGTREDVKKQLMGSGLIQEIVPELVYSFPIFTLDFCALLMEEIRHFYGSKLPARRPNSMNNYGIILNEIGLEPMIFDLQDAVIQPLASVLFPLEGSELESHHSFTIRYKGGEDTHLDVHTDDSDVTFNVNIFGNYTGAPLVFCGINGEPDHRHFRTAYQHQLGYAVMHRGRHRHGAEDITGGERMNLVVWSYSYNYRHSKESVKVHLKEASKPDERCVSYTHDRDFGRYKAWPPGKKERFMGRGWCPPRGKEYAYQKVGIHDDSWVCQMDSFLMCLTTSCLTDPKEEDNRNNDVKRCG
eukprot:s4231_g2.t1